jgi:Tol biopolymer transport system component
MNGDDFRQLTRLSGQRVVWPVWAADGKTLAYSVFGVNTYFIDTTKPWNSQIPEKLPPFPEGQLFNAWNWSPDGRMLAGFLNRDDGIAIYTPSQRTFERLTAVGSDPVWLSDSRRLLYHAKGRVHLIDRQSGSTRELISIAPEEIARRGFSVTPDDRYIYFSTSITEADVWFMEFEH